MSSRCIRKPEAILGILVFYSVLCHDSLVGAICTPRTQDGSQAVRPHWAKWSDAYVADADAKLKKAYAGRLLLLKDLANHFDPEGMFMNDHFSRLFSGL